MPNEIYHWGIKGQRWGFRRFQNEDGSLTPEGELRYNQGKQKAARGKAAEMYKTKKYKAKLALKQEKQKVKDAAELAKTAKKEQAKLNTEDRVIKKKAKNMTDEELKKEVDRLAMEIDYQKKSWRVKQGQKGPSSLDKLDDFFERPTGRIAADVGKSVATQVATVAVKSFFDKAKGGKDGKDGKGGKDGKDGKDAKGSGPSPINININNNNSSNNSSTNQNVNKNNNQNANVNQNNNYNRNTNQNANINVGSYFKSSGGYGSSGSGSSGSSGNGGNSGSSGSSETLLPSSPVKALLAAPKYDSSVIYGVAPKETPLLEATTSSLSDPEYLKKLITGG